MHVWKACIFIIATSLAKVALRKQKMRQLQPEKCECAKGNIDANRSANNKINFIIKRIIRSTNILVNNRILNIILKLYIEDIYSFQSP